MLTQSHVMVSNDKQFQKFTLPKGAKFWSPSQRPTAKRRLTATTF